MDHTLAARAISSADVIFESNSIGEDPSPSPSQIGASRKRSAGEQANPDKPKRSRQPRKPADGADGPASAALSSSLPAADSVPPADGSCAVAKADRRGQHWKDKVAQGAGPTPSRATAEWAAVRERKEAEVAALLRERGIDPTMPWNRPGARRLGNTGKVLYMLLVEHRLRGRVALDWAAGGGGFCGIERVVVAGEHREAFDAGLIPSACSREMAGPQPQRKTVAKMWRTAGLVERMEGGGLVYEYDEGVRRRIKAQHLA